jgi:hypothetical protein
MHALRAGFFFRELVVENEVFLFQIKPENPTLLEEQKITMKYAKICNIFFTLFQ